jgi:N-acetylmuramoyl-L-alanine amidase
MRKLSKIILHCSATKPEQEVNAAVIDSWHKQKGWKGIGYHYVLMPDGEIQKGRDVDEVGAHVKGENFGSIGVCYVGGLNQFGDPEDTMTMAQEMAWLGLVRSLRTVLGWMPVHGHNEYSSKACPSFDVQQKYGWMNEPKK